MSNHEAASSTLSSPVTERTALLRPRAISRATSVSIALPQEAPEDEVTGQKGISILRGATVIFAFTVLIFLQSANFTLMTTTQGLIADDLDAYSEVSWFTATYLVRYGFAIRFPGLFLHIDVHGGSISVFMVSDKCSFEFA